MKLKIITLVGMLLFMVTTFSCQSNASKTKTQVQSKIQAVNSDTYLSVKKVVDGDTFWVYNGTEKGEKIRLIGVDAPESRNVFKKKKGYYGAESKAFLTNLLTGKRVKLEYDVDRTDQYGRTLAYVYLEDGTFVNAALMKNGYAMVMTIPPNVKFADLFLSFQIEARENNRGLWNINLLPKE